MISFDSETHTYTNEEGKKLISVTTLLKQEGISPNYDCVNEDVLKAAADRGTYIHKEIVFSLNYCICFIGRHSLEIYLVHEFIFWVLQVVYINGNPCFLLPLSFLLSCFSAYLCKRVTTLLMSYSSWR